MKSALITGASRGIGKAIAIDLAHSGYQVCLNYNSNKSKAEELKIEIEKSGGTAICVQGDMSKWEDVEKVFDYTLKHFQSVDVLVNNAGVLRDNYAILMTQNEWNDVLNLNLNGTFYSSKLALKQMTKQKKGKIINIVSVSGIIGTPGQANYSASKGAVISMTRTLAKEYGKYNILVNAIAPGFIETEMTDTLPPKRKEKNLSLIPLSRYGSVKDVSSMVQFLASDSNTYITGQTIAIDGGISA